MSSRRKALLIGNATFAAASGLDALRGPTNDVVELARVLGSTERGKFEVQDPLVNKKREEILHAISEFLNGAARGDLLLIYYAGRAVQRSIQLS
jgi:hypothetical protein